MKNILKKLNRFFNGKWHIAILDLKKGRWIKDAVESNILYFKAENANGRHIIMQPKPEIEPYYILADDIDVTLINYQHKYADGNFRPGRLIVETSPQNYQVWIHSNRELNINEKLYWLKKLKSDPGAAPKNRWGRCPGFRNRKDIYCDSEGKYPLCKLIWIDWKNMTKIPTIISMKDNNLVHQNNSISPIIRSKYQKSSEFETGLAYQNNSISPIIRSQYQRKSESETDFSYALALIRRGYSDQEIEMRIRNERLNWNNHKTNRKKKYYLERTIEQARRIISY